MAIKWIEEEDIPMRTNRGRRPYGMVSDEMEMFMRSSHKACEVDISRYSKPRVAQSSYRIQAQKKGFPVKILIRDDRMFIVKKEVIEDVE